MILFTLNCPKCKSSEFHPDLEKTLYYYDRLYEYSIESIELINEQPPFLPEDVIMVCENPDCGHEDKYSVEKLVHELRQMLSEYAWATKKRIRPSSITMLEETLMDYFSDNVEVNQVTLEKDAYLRKLYFKSNGKKS